MNRNKHILIFGGTSEGRRLAEHLCKAGFLCTVCVATEYGEMVVDKLPGLIIHQGRMDAAQMEIFIQDKDYLAVVDATHPYATEVSVNIKKSIKKMTVPYIRLKRDTQFKTKQEKVLWFTDARSCAEALSKTEGNILLTTGSKNLKEFSGEALKDRLYVRVLPDKESITLCEKEGICGKQIIAMQGPFSQQMNEAMIRQFHITSLVTKESGAAGGFFSKVQAAYHTNTTVYVIGNPEKEGKGLSYQVTLKSLYELADVLLPKPNIRISLIGMGMGNERLLTTEAKEAIRQAEVIFGSGRLLEATTLQKEQYPYYQAKDILPKVKELSKEVRKELKIAVLFSGDTGFYSGAENLYQALQRYKEEGEISCNIRIFSGISSLSYLASKTGTSYQDAAVVSIHGRKADIVRTVTDNRKTFVLLSGVKDIHRLGELFITHKLSHLSLEVGYQLSYPEEEIININPFQCGEFVKEGLYCCLIENEQAGGRMLTHGLRDECFIRGKVPMTKEEVRDILICKLQLTKESVLFDIGSGTGSIAVECARLSPHVAVYAIETKHEAAELTRRNCEKFLVENVEIIEAKAPDGFLGLPIPTHAFIGGSGGNIREILRSLYQINPTLRVVMNAVTLESIGSMTTLLGEFPVNQEEVIQVQISRSKKAGGYHMMQAENPIFIISFEFIRKEEE